MKHSVAIISTLKDSLIVYIMEKIFVSLYDIKKLITMTGRNGSYIAKSMTDIFTVVTKLKRRIT